MEAKLEQEIDKNAILPHKNWLKIIWMQLRKPFDNLSKLEIVVFLTNTVLLMIMFGAGISTMIHEATNFFPIHPLLMYPLGFILMGIVVMATHVVTKLSAELVFNWWEYNLHYKILLPITNIALIVLCWSVQSEGGEIMNTSDIEAKIAIIEADTISSGLQQLDRSIWQMQAQLGSIQETIAHYDSLRATRKGHWLREAEVELMMKAQEPQHLLNQELAKLTTARIAEQNNIYQRNQAKIATLRAELERRINKGRNKAGLAEGLMVFISFFMMAYKNRFREEEEIQEVEVSIEEKDEKRLKPFPRKLNIDKREAILASIQRIVYNKKHEILEICYLEKDQLEEVALAIKAFMKAVKTNRSEYYTAVEEDNKKVRDNKIRNMQFQEQLLGKSGLSIDYLQSVYEYEPMYPDYWISTTGSTAESSAVVLEKDCAVASSG